MHVTMLGVIGLALAGNCLLTSAGKPNILPDGAVSWSPDSLLLAVVEILDLNYSQPTPLGIAVKSLVFGVAAGAAALVTAIGLISTAMSQPAVQGTDTIINVEELDSPIEESRSLARRQLNPVRTAQALMLVFVLWSFASQAWSHASEFAFAGSILLAIQCLWPLSISLALNRRTVVYSAYLIVAVLTVTAILAALYHNERNPTLRASYPIGNPIFLAACLIPGIILSVTTIITGGSDIMSRQLIRGCSKVILCTVSLVLIMHAFNLAGSRGPWLALGTGGVALLFFSTGRKMKISIAAFTIASVVLLCCYFVEQQKSTSFEGRNATIRTRLYAWNYALNMIQEKPIQGYGQGAYSLLADGMAAADVQSDPAALEYRIAHAHNEWLETGADLGSVGLVLILGCLLLTMYGGVLAIPQMQQRTHKLAMIGLLSSLVAMMCEEGLSVGLRIAGLPFFYYTIIGLIWALAAPLMPARASVLSRRREARVGLGLFAFACCVGAFEFSRRDFAAARAMYDVTGHVAEKRWVQATSSAHRGFSDRLSPARKLVALEQTVSSHLLSAQAYHQQFLRIVEAASTTSEANDVISRQGLQYEDQCKSHTVLGLQSLALLKQCAPEEMYRYRLEYGFESLLADIAELNGHPEEIQEHRQSAFNALDSLMARRPFDPDLAIKYVLAGEELLGTDQAVEVLARPLRLNCIPPQYAEIIATMVNSPVFAESIVSVFEDALPPTVMALDKTQGQWAPEKLRLGAATFSSISRFDKAMEYLKAATIMYAELKPPSPLARAASHAELADAEFFAGPANVAEAINQAELSLKYMPNSEKGRALRDAIADRLITYHLAAEHEPFSRKLLSQSRPRLTKPDLDTVIASRYVTLAYSVFTTAFSHHPEMLVRWSNRALALNDKIAPPWFLAADIALAQRDDIRAAECVRKIAIIGDTTENMIDVIRRGLEVMPESEVLKQLASEIQQMVEQNDRPYARPPTESGEK